MSDEPHRPPERLLLGAGPSQVPAEVLEAVAGPTVGHFDPSFLELTEVVAERLRKLFLTANPATLALPSTGSGGAAALANNFVEPGDRVAVAVAGVFGERLAEALERAGAEVVRVEAEWGRIVEPERLIAAVEDGLSAVAVVHGETSTGVMQPLDGLAEACRERDALLLLDCVTSLGGCPVLIDEWGVDAAFSGTQKCLNCPPGLAPFTAGERAIERRERRRRRPASWYFDLDLLRGYWDPEVRSYHHTVPVNMVYGLAEALRLIERDGLANRWRDHARAHAALRAGLGAWGLEVLAPPAEALWPIVAFAVPGGIDEAAVRAHLLTRRGIEVSPGLGPLAGRALRVGLMGRSASLETVELVLDALAEAMSEQGSRLDSGEAAAAARELHAATEPRLPPEPATA